MDPKMIEMNNLRVLNDYLTQTIEVLGRGQQRLGAGSPTPGFGYSPFGGQIPATAGATDTVYGPWGFGGSMYPGMPFGAQYGSTYPGTPYGAQYGSTYPGTPFAGQHGAIYGGTPFAGQHPFTGYGAGFGAWQQPWGQQPWGPISEVTRQAHFTQALAAKQSVLEAMCRACGIPV